VTSTVFTGGLVAPEPRMENSDNVPKGYPGGPSRARAVTGTAPASALNAGPIFDRGYRPGIPSPPFLAP